jgi:hypothetical protein
MPLTCVRGHGNSVPHACSFSEHDTQHVVVQDLGLVATQTPITHLEASVYNASRDVSGTISTGARTIASLICSNVDWA